MKGDREKCIRAGASDYITKPVDPDKLLSVMHIWFKKSEAVHSQVTNEIANKVIFFSSMIGQTVW